MPTQTFTSTTTWTAPPGVFSVTAQCTGAGGGGSGGDTGINSVAGGGGGGGAFAKKLSIPVVPGTSYTVTVGTGGAGGASGQNGSDGGDSWFKTSGTVFAPGGHGGGFPPGGSGGSLAGAIGDTTFGGGDGADSGGGTPPSYGGGGGGGAGDTGGGSPGSSMSGGGGSATDGGNGGNGADSGSAAQSGSNVGGGGGGGHNTLASLGADGAAGEVVLSWTVVIVPNLDWAKQQPLPPARVKPRQPGSHVNAPYQPPAAQINWFHRDTSNDVPRTAAPRRPAGAQVVDPFPIPTPAVLFWFAQQPIVPPPARPREAGQQITDPLTPTIAMVDWWMWDNANDVPRVAKDRWQNYTPFVEPLNPIAPAITFRFYAAARGLYRIFNAAQYRLYRSNIAPPAETDSPFATSTGLPATPTPTFANGTWYLSMSYFDGVLDSGFLPLGPRGETYVTLEISAGHAQSARPGGPVSATLQQLAAGIVRINAFYVRSVDGANAATEWSIAYTINGTTPPNDAPTRVVEMTAGGVAILSFDLPPQVNGTMVKVQLQTRRGATYSLPGTVLSLTVDSNGPTAPLSETAWIGSLPQE